VPAFRKAGELRPRHKTVAPMRQPAAPAPVFSPAAACALNIA